MSEGRERLGGDGADVGWVAALGSAAMIAEQVGGKAARDALYLTHHPVESLPLLIMISGAATFLVSIGAARALGRWGPRRFVPVSFGLSALALVGVAIASAAAPEPASTAFYIYHTISASVLISGFWSLVNERWDPRAAKSVVARIATGGTFGGLLGGVGAQLLGSAGKAEALLWLLVGLHLATAAAAARVARGLSPTRAEASEPKVSAREVFSGNDYLRTTAWLVACLAISAVLIDYFLKVTAARHFADQSELLSFFGAFYAATGLLAFALQAGVGAKLLERLGLGAAIQALPLTTALASVVALVTPGVWTAAALRAGENAVRSSFFRSGYELLYTPVSKTEKRSVKALIDVAVERGGDIVGGLVIQAMLWTLPDPSPRIFPGLVLGAAIAASLVAAKLRRGYSKSLERSLANRAIELKLEDVRDSTTRRAVLATRWGRENTRSVERPASRKLEAPSPVDDPLSRRLRALRSADPESVQEALRDPEPLAPAHVPVVIATLAREELWRDAIIALRPLASRIAGQLGDYLSDPDVPFAVRRRIPWVLRAADSRRAAQMLLDGLLDPRFEVRFRAARALHKMKLKLDDLGLPDQLVLDALAEELATPLERWRARRLLDAAPESELAPLGFEPPSDIAVSQSLEHVFCLLSLLLPDRPLQLAFRGLVSEDTQLRGTALEYLDGIVPEVLRKPMMRRLEDGALTDGPSAAASPAQRPMELVESELWSRLGTGEETP